MRVAYKRSVDHVRFSAKLEAQLESGPRSLAGNRALVSSPLLTVLAWDPVVTSLKPGQYGLPPSSA